MASLAEVNVVFFMEEVQKYDCLYNKYSKNYKDKYVKINCWTKIGEKFEMSAADAEKKFKNIRTGYGRYLKKVKSIPSGSGRDAVPVPKDFAGLDWLQKYISHRPTVTNISVNSIEVDSDGDENSVSEQGEINIDDVSQETESENLDDSGASENIAERGLNEANKTELAEVPEKKKKKVYNTSRPWSTGNRKRESKQKVDVEEELLVTANSLLQQAKKIPEPDKAEPDCENSYFCKSLLPRLKKLPPRTRALVRMKIEQILFEAEFASTPSHQMQMRAASSMPMHHGYYQQSQGNIQEPQHLDFHASQEQPMHSDFISL